MEILKNSRVLRIIPFLLIMTLLCPFADGKIINVDDNGPADFNTIQAAIDDANDGDTVLVATGTYAGEGNRDIDFKGKAITVKSEEGPQTCIIDCQGSEYEQHRGFYFHNGEDTNSILQGFTITNGYYTYNMARAFMGGAIFCDASSPRINNCIVTENIALDGGGIGCNSSNAVIANCIIIGNRSIMGRGGGIFCVLGSPYILDCLIEDNTAFEDGGGVKCESSNTTFSRCIIRNNSADRGSGIDCRGEVLITNCFITGNNAKNSGGGINCRDETTIINCIITGNKTGGSGGGIRCNVEISLLNCTIFGNSAGSYSYGGGGIHLNAGRISNSIIYGNITRKTTGIEIAQGPHGAAGCRPESIKITNSVVGSDPNAIDDPHCYSGEWLHTDPLFANPGYWNANGTPDDPNEDFWVEGDYHLKSQAGRWDPNSQSWVQDDVTSPCIDAGDPNSPIGSEPFPNGGIINMGAYGGTVEASKSLNGKSIYIFWPEQSMVIQTGGIAGVNGTYILSGQFQLTIDFGAGKARFSNVEAIATDNSEPVRKLDPNDLFNLAGLTGTISRNGSIQFTGRTADESNVLLYITLSDEWMSLKGQTTPPPNSADFFIFDLDAVAKRKYGGGTGEPNDPYLIYTAEQMNQIGSNPEDWNKHFKLMADIDLNAYTNDQFNIIGGNPPFTGVFDGNRHVISNFSYTSPDKDCIGLFGYVYRFSGKQAEIKNLGLIDPNINAGTGDYVGSLIGWLDAGTITGCYVEGGNVVGDEIVGGLVGAHGHRIPGFDPSVIPPYPPYTISYCYSTSRVKGTIYVGGMVGFNTGRITNCYSMGSVFGNDIVGGLVGQDGDWGLDPTWGGKMLNCYSTSHVVGQSNTGGLVGLNVWGMIIYNCFWDIQTSGWTTSDGGTGKTTAEMQMSGTFLDAGWDFVDETENGTEDIWCILEGQDYPHLWWEDDGN